MNVTIKRAEYTDAGWFVVATVESETGTRCGSYQLDLPEDATEAQLITALRALYG